MTAFRIIRTAMKALQRNPLRAMLTTLGIVIGVAAVIAMMEIGAGSSSALQKTIASMGANVMMVRPGTAASGGISFGAGTVTTLTPQDYEAILRQCPSLSSAAPVVRARTQVVYGNRNWVPSSIYGTTPSFLDIRDWTNLAEGAMFSQRDVLTAGKVCVLGQTLARELFQGEFPIGKEIRVKNVPFRVVGVLSAKGANMMGSDQDDILLAPWTTIKYRVTGAALENTNQSAGSDNTAGSVNTLSNLYPGDAPNLYPAKSAVQAADNPMPVRFANIDQILTAAQSTADIPSAIDEITAVAGWEKAVKRVIDRGLFRDVLIITTGSKATDLRHGSERLPGRKGKLSKNEYIFLPISYREFKSNAREVHGEKSWIAYLLTGGSPVACNDICQFERLPEYFIQIVRD